MLTSQLTGKQHPFRSLRKVTKDHLAGASSTIMSENNYPHKQRIFGTPGASLVNADLPENQVLAGIRGEERVGRFLKEYVNSHENTYVFHSVRLPGQLGDIDHLVVKGDTLILIDTKNWKSDAHYELSVTTDPGVEIVRRNGALFSGSNIHLRRQWSDWASYMGKQWNTQAILTIANEEAFPQISESTGYQFVNLLGLTSALDRVLPDTAETLSDEVLSFFIDHVQTEDSVFDLQSSTGRTVLVDSTVHATGPATKLSKWVTVWSIMNYVFLPVLFPFSALSCLALIIVGHKHLNEIRGTYQKGAGLVITSLIFSYILLGVWLFGAFIVGGYFIMR